MSKPLVRYIRKPFFLNALLSFILLFFLGFSSISYAAFTPDFASWNGFLFQGMFSTESGYYLEIQSRLNQNLSSGNRYIIRPAFRYFLSPSLSIWAGYGWLPAFSPFRGENRLWQQAFYQTRAGQWLHIARFRIDERWLANSEGTAFRARFMLRTQRSVNGPSTLSVCVWDEYFQNLNNVTRGPLSGFDQNRVFFGLNYLATQSIQIEPGYLNVLVNQAEPAPNIMNHIFALYTIFNF
jgi:hypothetical protein